MSHINKTAFAPKPPAKRNNSWVNVQPKQSTLLLKNTSPNKRVLRNEPAPFTLDVALGLILSLAGCLWQYYIVSEHYFKFKSITEFSIEKDSLLRYPALTMCIPLKNVWKTDNHSAPPHLTYSNIMENTFEAKDIVEQYYYRKVDKYYVANASSSAVFGVLKTRQFYRSDKKCFTYYDKNEKTLRYNKRQFTHDWKGIFYAFIFNHNSTKTSSINYYLHEPNKLPQGNDDSNIVINYPNVTNSSKDMGQSLIYKTVVSTNLPPPYKSQCNNYSDLGLTSADHCYERCFLKQSAAKLGRIPFIATITDDNAHFYKTLPIISASEFKNSPHIQKTTLVIEEFCSNLCKRPDCERVYYIPSFYGEPWNLPKSGTIGIAIYAPSQPKIVSNLRPKMNINEYIIQLVTILGFWFGLSALEFFTFIKKRVLPLVTLKTFSKF